MEIKRNIKITFNWWNDEKGEIPSNHLSFLEKEAENRIFEMRKEGYTSGELNTKIDDIEYSGWWDISY